MAPQNHHLFIDNVRFWAMAAVVALHTAGGIAGTLHTASSAVVFATEDLLKFGTIGFFLVSGFLLGDRFETSPRLPFFTRRARKVFVPWLFWFALQAAYFLLSQVHLHAEPFTLTLLARVTASCLVATAFWFVPNLLISIAVLLLFRPFLNDLRLGLALLAISLFYAVNIYAVWLPPSHTIAPFGFVFFLWLGAFASRNQPTLQNFLTRTPTPVLAAPILATALASVAETHLLTQLHSTDPTNSLRLSNQLFSIAVIFLLAKPRRRLWPTFLNVRTEIFGVYLTLTFVLAIVETSTRHILPHSIHLQGNLAFITLSFLATLIVATLCLSLTKLLNRSPHLAWLVGSNPPHNLSQDDAHPFTRYADPRLQLPAGAPSCVSPQSSSFPSPRPFPRSPSPVPRRSHLWAGTPGTTSQSTSPTRTSVPPQTSSSPPA